MKKCIRQKMLPRLLKSGQFCLLRNAAALGLTLALCGLPGALRAQIQTDDFNDGDDSFPLQWTEYDAISSTPYGVQNSWSFPVVGDGFGYTITATNSPDPGTVGPGRAGSLLTNVVYDTFYVSVDVVGWDTNKDSAFGILARVDTPGLGTTAGYSFTYQTDDHDVQISRITGETPSTMPETLKGITLDSTKRYRLVFQGSGDRLEGRIYDLADLSTPLLVVQGTDATYASGIAGLVVYDNGSGGGTTGADATFDNFLASGTAQLVCAPSTPTVADNWNDGNDIDWTRYPEPTTLNQTWSFPTNPASAGNFAYRLTSDAGAAAENYGRNLSVRTNDPDFADFCVTADLIDWDNNQSQQMGLVARLQPVSLGLPVPSCYMLVYANRSSALSGGTDQLRLYEVSATVGLRFLHEGDGGLGQFCCGAPTVPNASASPNPTNHYRLIFKGVGNRLTGQILDLNTGLPLVFNQGGGQLTNIVSTSWATNFATGKVGVGVFQNNAGAPDVTFDNFVTTSPAPILTITPNGATVDITWSANQEGIWVLETSPDLPGATWTEVPFSALTFASGNLTYSVPADGNSFFRLRRI